MSKPDGVALLEPSVTPAITSSVDNFRMGYELEVMPTALSRVPLLERTADEDDPELPERVYRCLRRARNLGLMLMTKMAYMKSYPHQLLMFPPL